MAADHELESVKHDNNEDEDDEYMDSDKVGLLTSRELTYKREPSRVPPCNVCARIQEIVSGCTLALLALLLVILIVVRTEPRAAPHVNAAAMAAGCVPGEILGCHGSCAPGSWLGDGFCDDPTDSISLNCEALALDGGDCDPHRSCLDTEVLDCKNNCAPKEWIGDGACDDPDTSYGAYWYNCATLSFDGGDCAVDQHGCRLSEVPDCDMRCVPKSWLGDGTCDESYEGHNLNCEQNGFDDGDCTKGEDGCYTDYMMDCNGICAPANWLGDGLCDDLEKDGTYDSFVYNCSELGYDGGDCLHSDSGCYGGHVSDCRGLHAVCVPETWIGDGECDIQFEGYHLNCSAMAFDGGDCI